MANIQNRTSVLAVTVESTEGTPVVPSGASNFLALQDDFTMTPNFDTLENAELKSSLAPGKAIQGLENPSATGSHYLRASGTVATAPDYSEILQAAFGTESIRSTERDTVSSSTTSVIKVDSGEGSEFARGDLLLVKDATNGYSIRPVHSVSTDDLTLGFNLASAPASGVNLGRSVMYRPANSGHQTLSMFHYLGNSGAVQAMAGGRVTELGISFAAGELINMNYSISGTKYYFNPINITSSNKYLDVNEDAGGETSVSIAEKLYRDPVEVCDALATALNDALSNTYTVTYSSSTGKVTIAQSGGSSLSILWNSGTNTANSIGTTIGFAVAADDTSATTYTSDNAIDWSADYTPSYDSSDPLAAKNNMVLIGDASDNTCFAASTVDFTMATPTADVLSICAESGKSGSVLTSRNTTIAVTALLQQHDVSKFNRFRENTETRFFYAFGSKSGGNWEEAKSGGIYVPTATISEFEIGNENGLVTLNMTLTAFADSSGNGETYLGFV